VSSEIDDLHHEVFGFRPAKAGEAYERVAAVVLAGLGWDQVVHDARESAEGKRAKHQLDVTARHPNGTIARLLVECKDWDKAVGKGTLDTLVGVRGQINADAAAVVTTVGYKKGAIAVAVDENVALLRLRAFDPEDPVTYVKTVTIELTMYGAIRSDLNVALAPGQLLPAGPQRFSMATSAKLQMSDGTPAETIEELFKAHAAPMEEGVFEQRAEFEDGRLLELDGGERLSISAVTWTETVSATTQTIETTGEGEPVLVLEQLDENGDLDSGRVVVDRELYAWEIDTSGNVTPRGQLGAPDDRNARQPRRAAAKPTS
jgi:hypothetical protein